MTQPDHLRASDQDRQLVEQVLATAYAQGRITTDEHSERLEQVWQAKTFGELRPITADLVEIRQEVELKLTPAPGDGFDRAIVDTLNPTPESERINAVMSSNRRLDQAWRLRKNVNISVVMGDVHLDLRNAVFEADQINIHVNAIMGEVKLFVPAGVRVVNETTPIMGETKIRGLIEEATGPVVRLDGMVLMAELDVYGPTHLPRSMKRRMEKRRNRSIE